MLLVILLLFLSSCCEQGTPTDNRYQCKTVARIGACDRYGFCGVQWTDNSFDKYRYPVEGLVVCKKEWN